jgi:hypothetical protein
LKSHCKENIDGLRHTLAYAEAKTLMQRQRKLNGDRKAIRQQLNSLKRLSRATVAAAQYDIDSEKAE